MSTLASVAVLAISSVAIAQVGQTPEEQKLGPNASLPENVSAPGDDLASGDTASPPGAPSTALVNSAAGPPPPK